jgi:cytochrome c-type biogenesis protein CcmH
MTFWLVLGVMTAAALAAVVWPLTRRPGAALEGNDIAVYRDQLDEIERDLASGTIGAVEAEAARLEVSRRLIAAGDAAARPGASGAADPWRQRLVVAGAALAIPIGAVGLYLALGSPDLPGQPLAERMAAGHAGKNIVAAEDPDRAAMTALVAKVEAHLAANPDDGRGWEVIAPVYMRLMRFDDAVKANRNAIRVLGETAERLGYLGESLTAAADGTVTPEAKETLERARQMDPENVAAGFYLGVAAKQAGNKDEAARIWQDMIARAPEGADWLPFVKRALAVLDGPPPGHPATAQSGPQPLEPPEELPPEQRDMARGMVERLADRLKQNGEDVEGWLRLVRSYMVMADRDAARAAVLEARAALAGDTEKLARLESGVQQLRLEGVPPGAASASAEPQKPAIALPKLSPLPPPETAQQTASANPHPVTSDPAQDAQIRGMVDRLASRLRENGSDVEGWVRLLRSYVVLGDREKARAAAGDARRALSGQLDKLKELEGALRELGIES